MDLETKGNRNEEKQIQLIVKVIALVHLGKLITNAIQELKDENLSLELKTIVTEYIVKVGTIIGPNLRFTSKPFYEKEIYNTNQY